MKFVVVVITNKGTRGGTYVEYNEASEALAKFTKEAVANGENLRTQSLSSLPGTVNK